MTCLLATLKNSSVAAGWEGDCLGTLPVVFRVSHAVEMGVKAQMAAVAGACDSRWVRSGV